MANALGKVGSCKASVSSKGCWVWRWKPFLSKTGFAFQVWLLGRFQLEEASEEDDEEDEELDEMFGLDEFAPEADDAGMGMGGDATDDMMGDVGADDDMDGLDGAEGGVESRVDSLEDELEALKAEFEKLLAGEEDEPEHDDMFGGDDEGDDEGEEEADDEAGDDEEEKEAFAFEAKKAEDKKKADDKKKKTAGEEMREYVEKVAPAKMGDNGANTKSLVASKNDMGGTTANILASVESLIHIRWWFRQSETQR